MSGPIGRGDALAVIPARGGSKGILRKNLVELEGRSLVDRAVATCLAARRLDRVVVSTDDQEIGAVAQLAGAEVVWRPTALAGDEASSEAAVVDALDQLEAQEGYVPEVVLLVQATAVLMQPGDIDGVVDLLRSSEADSTFAAAEFRGFLWGTAGGVAKAINHHAAERLRRQDREPEYVEAGSAYAMDVAAFRATGSRFCGMTRIFLVDRWRVLEIDEPGDLLVATALLARLGDT